MYSTNDDPKLHPSEANLTQNGIDPSAVHQQDLMLVGLGRKVEALAQALGALAPALEALPLS